MTTVNFEKSKPEPKYTKILSKDSIRTNNFTKLSDELITNNSAVELPRLLLLSEPVSTTSTTSLTTMEQVNKLRINVASLLSSIIKNQTKEEKGQNKDKKNLSGPTIITTLETVSSRARALNVSAAESTNALHCNLTDLSDISMNDEEKEVEDEEDIVAHKNTSINMTLVHPLLVSAIMCKDGNKTYSVGEKIIRKCEEQCLCEKGGNITNCEPICQSPYVKSNKKNNDPFCDARDLAENPCCAILVCSDSVPEPEETCIFGNSTITRGQRYEDGCLRTCICEAGGHLNCQSRCPPNDTSDINQHDRCVVLQDPSDACCTITLCDVTLGDHEIKPESPADLFVKLIDVKILNSTAIKLKLSSKLPNEITIELSENNHVWKQVTPTKDGIISNLQPAHGYYIRVVEGSRIGPAIHVSLLTEVIKTSVTKQNEKDVCNHRGKTYKIGAEWYDECIAVCFCNETAQIECATIECPTDFGLDVLDPHCLDWETVPPNHVAKAPNCCPQEVRCKNNGSCAYGGKTYDNWSKIPMNISGCEKECFCGFGNVTCNQICPPVLQQPPHTLNCKPHEAVLTKLPNDECCLHWSCLQNGSILPGKNSSAFIYPGPIAIDATEKRPNDKSESKILIEKQLHSSSFLKPTQFGDTNPPLYNVSPNSDIVHYPMDPGHPAIPYMGPYNPDFKPTQPSVGELFHLTENFEKTPIKEKIKSKSDSKKPVNTIKILKENIDQFPGPLPANHFFENIYSSNKSTLSSPPISMSQSPNKLPELNKGNPLSDHIEQPHFIPLNVHDHTSVSTFDFTPSNGENIPSVHFGVQLENSAAGPPYGDLIGLRPELLDPNNVVSSVSKKKISNPNTYTNEKSEHSVVQVSKHPDTPPQNPNPPTIHDELYHLINLQHSDVVQSDYGSTNSHSDLYGIHKKIMGTDKLSVSQARPIYFGLNAIPPKKSEAHGKPQIFTQKDENGQMTYHVHAADVPNSPQQLEELLAHIAKHDPSNNPYQQHYPVHQESMHLQGPPPSLTAHNIDSLQIQQGATDLTPHIDSHDYVARAPPGSGQPGFGQGISQFSGILSHGSSNLPSQQTYEISIEDLRAISGNSVRLIFTVPSILIGLHGRVEVHYTSDKSNMDPSTWKSQIFAPPGDLIDTEDLEFDLSGLKPSTVYRLMIAVKLRDLSNIHISKIYEVRTLDKQTLSSLPADINIDSELAVLQVNSTFAEFEWKKFSNYELQFIDGIYLMYKAYNEKTYSITPLLHRSVNHYILNHLRPLTAYEVHLSTKDIIGQTNVFINSKTVNFTTTHENDPYLFDVKVEIKAIKPTHVEISWNGIPIPQDKYVNIYRAVYQSDSGKEDTSTFKIAKKDAPAKTIISDLKPGTRYRLWIEVYLTNGKIKKSNVQDFVTKPGILLPSDVSQQGKFASISLHEGDYYGPLVIVAIVASLAILSTLILLMMLMKKRTSSKADISPRKTTSDYDNPSYKVELQQETMGNLVLLIFSNNL
ncbi:PREDICTED: putative epidermal cell surface receptor [Ceratosolen solmsi marchali]|uniref:Epidermal cell surface receptor n=1 Tax=Ceratosolen solmsi marchali TaxID=326594 RepID=A0AAJ6YUM3_9HYME|nr:PREDICTED: putative epidermal cell surface receptor [Ceratosolen solmsi marchali]